MRNRFSIGEMAKLHNVPVKTLRYYDEIGLLIPIQVGENGYRYYSAEQFEQLDTIIYLKRLGLTLEKIKGHLKYRNVEEFLELLRTQQRATERSIHELELIRKRFHRRIYPIEEALGITEIGGVTIKHIPERKIIRMEEMISNELELELAVKKLLGKVAWTSALFIGNVGVTISQTQLEKRMFGSYNSVFILVEEEEFVSVEQETQFGEGEYACIFYRGCHDQSPYYYQLLIDYIADQGLSLDGEANERTIIDDFITRDTALHLTEIQVPIIRKA